MRWICSIFLSFLITGYLNAQQAPCNVEARDPAMPVYTPIARAAHIQGIVEFTATIGSDGTITQLQLVRGHPSLVIAAKDAPCKQVIHRTVEDIHRLAPKCELVGSVPSDDCDFDGICLHRRSEDRLPQNNGKPDAGAAPPNPELFPAAEPNPVAPPPSSAPFAYSCSIRGS